MYSFKFEEEISKMAKDSGFKSEDDFVKSLGFTSKEEFAKELENDYNKVQEYLYKKEKTEVILFIVGFIITVVVLLTVIIISL